MKILKIKAFLFSELGSDAKEYANETYNWNRKEAYQDLYDFCSVLDDLGEMFHTESRDWSFDSSSHDIGTLSVSNGSLKGNRLESLSRGVEAFDERYGWEYGWLYLNGARAMSKCWNMFGAKYARSNYVKSVYSPKRYCSRGGKRRESRIFVNNDGGSFGGYCLASLAVEPLQRMMDGYYIKLGWTIADMIEACYEALFSAAQADCAYMESEEYWSEASNANGFLYDINGRRIESSENQNAGTGPECGSEAKACAV